MTTNAYLPNVWVVWDGDYDPGIDPGIDAVFDNEAAAREFATAAKGRDVERFTLHADPPAKVMRYRYTIKADGDFRVHGWQVDNDPNLADSLDNYSDGDLSLSTYVAGLTPDQVRDAIASMAERARVLDGGA